MFGTGSAEPVGMVVRVAPGPNGGFDLLYEVRLESLEAGPVLCQTADGPAIASLTLPYVL
jgi:hypothetical protein